MTASMTVNAPVDEVTEPIHVSVASLVCGILGFALWGIGSLIRAGSLEHVRAAEALEVVGPLLIALAIILYVDHLSTRIGRTAVVLLIIGPIVYGVSRIPAFLKLEHPWMVPLRVRLLRRRAPARGARAVDGRRSQGNADENGA